MKKTRNQQMDIIEKYIKLGGRSTQSFFIFDFALQFLYTPAAMALSRPADQPLDETINQQ
jgi:hypothetical protein